MTKKRAMKDKEKKNDDTIMIMIIMTKIMIVIINCHVNNSLWNKIINVAKFYDVTDMI